MKSATRKKPKPRRPPPWVKFPYIETRSTKQRKARAERKCSSAFSHIPLKNYGRGVSFFQFEMSQNKKPLYNNALQFCTSSKSLCTSSALQLYDNFRIVIVDLFISRIRKISKCRTLINEHMKPVLSKRKKTLPDPLLRVQNCDEKYEVKNFGVSPFSAQALRENFDEDKMILQKRGAPFEHVRKLRVKIQCMIAHNHDDPPLTSMKGPKWIKCRKNIDDFHKRESKKRVFKQKFQSLLTPGDSNLQFAESNPFRIVRYDLICRSNHMPNQANTNSEVKKAVDEIHNMIPTVITPTSARGIRNELFGDGMG